MTGASRLNRRSRKKKKAIQKLNPRNVSQMYYQSLKIKQILNARTAVETLTMTVSDDRPESEVGLVNGAKIHPRILLKLQMNI